MEDPETDSNSDEREVLHTEIIRFPFWLKLVITVAIAVASGTCLSLAIHQFEPVVCCMVVLFESVLAAILLGIWAPVSVGIYGFRFVAMMAFVACSWYLIAVAHEEKFIIRNLIDTNSGFIKAITAMAIFGIPCLYFAIRGKEMN